ncbi:MAG: hypothetical protein M0P22_05900 [Methanoculleus sp.]|nr:hypothetical protein [Methanoculleus sp.]
MKMKTIGIGIGILVLLGIICTAAGVSLLLDAGHTPDSPLPGNHSDLAGSVKSGSTANFTYTVSAALPSVPETVVLYRVVKPEVTTELISSIAEKMGLNGTVRESHDQMLLSDDPYSLEVHMKSGRIVLIDTPRWMNPNDRDQPENLPQDDEAVRIATGYLEKTGLLPPDATPSAIDHQEIARYNEKGERIGTAYEEVQVSYSRTIDGLPVVGSKLTVEIGGDGDILSVYKLWRDYAPEKEVAITTPKEALDELKTAGVATGLSADITGIKLGYYEAPATREPTYLVPVYIFTGRVLDGTGEETSFVRYVPASPDFREEIPAVK